MDKNITKKDLEKWSIQKLRDTLWKVNVDRRKAWVGYFKFLNKSKALEKELAHTKQLLEEANKKIEELKNKNHISDDHDEDTDNEEEPPRTVPVEKNQKYCNVCKTNVSRKNFSAHCRTKKHLKNAENN